jgi:hypothetical protein
MKKKEVQDQTVPILVVGSVFELKRLDFAETD